MLISIRERRIAPRVSAVLTVAVEVAGYRTRASTVDVSECGLSLRVSEPPPLGEEVKVYVRGAGRRSLRLVGTVVRGVHGGDGYLWGIALDRVWRGLRAATTRRDPGPAPIN